MIRKIGLTAFGACAGFALATFADYNSGKKTDFFEKTFGVKEDDYPYLLKDKDIVDQLVIFAEYRQHAPELFEILLKYFNKICAYYQNAQDYKNSTSRMGDIISVSSLRTSLLATMRNYFKLVLHYTQRDIEVKKRMTMAGEALAGILDGIRDEIKPLVEKRLEERAVSAMKKEAAQAKKTAAAKRSKPEDTTEKETAAKRSKSPQPVTVQT